MKSLSVQLALIEACWPRCCAAVSHWYCLKLSWSNQFPLKIKTNKVGQVLAGARCNKWLLEWWWWIVDVLKHGYASQLAIDYWQYCPHQDDDSYHWDWLLFWNGLWLISLSISNYIESSASHDQQCMTNRLLLINQSGILHFNMTSTFQIN